MDNNFNDLIKDLSNKRLYNLLYCLLKRFRPYTYKISPMGVYFKIRIDNKKYLFKQNSPRGAVLFVLNYLDNKINDFNYLKSFIMDFKDNKIMINQFKD